MVFYSITAVFAGSEPGIRQVEGDTTFNTVSVTDSLGRTVTIKKPVRRIAYLHFSIQDTLKILNAWEMVVARDGFQGDAVIYPNSDDIPTLIPFMGNPYQPNKELLLSLDVDLLILPVIPMPGLDELLADLRGLIPVAVFNTYNPEKISQSITALGSLLGREKEAKQFVSWSDAIVDFLLQRTADMPQEEKTRIFMKTGWGEPEDIMSFSDEFDYVPFRNRITGSINVAGDCPSSGGWIQTIDLEWLIMQDIDVVYIVDSKPKLFGLQATDYAPVIEHYQKVKELAVFSGTDAYKNNKFYYLYDNFFGTPGSIIGFAYLAKWFHPDLFEDLNPKALHQEYLLRFMRVEVDLSKQGVFVYPEE